MAGYGPKVRNFWVTAEIDGRENPIASGPRDKDGGFDLSVKMRDEGRITEPLSILGRSLPDGRLRLRVLDEFGNTLFEHETQR